jgi:hypothetical protein
MKVQAFARVFAFVALMLVVSLACGGGGATPTPIVIVVHDTAVPPPATAASASSSGGLSTFTDQNDLFAIEVPGDWPHEQTVADDNTYYFDTFKSPDELALVENIVYDDGTAFSGSQKATFALYLLNTFYSSTGAEGDIRVSDDSIMKDGSERLTWSSKGGGYSGISFLETRGTTTFLFFTVEWVDSAQDQYLDTLNAVIESYRIP